MKKNLTKVIFLILVLALTIVPVLAVSSFAEGGAWTLVTDASTLAAGDQIVIVASGHSYALSTTQNDNNRGQASVEKNANNTATFGDDVQVITLEAGTTDGTFAFNVGGGYLYAASSSKNYLRTEETLSDNSSWKITIADGVATVVAQGVNTRNTMQYNNSSSLFACYASASQKAISIYKLTSNTSTEEYTSTFYVDGVVDEGISGKGLTNFPAAPTLAEGYSDDYTFVGWAKEEVVNSTIEPEIFEAGDTLTIYEDTSFYAIFKWEEAGDEVTAYMLKDIANITAADVVVVTMKHQDGTVYALGNDKGTSSAPTATLVTVEDGIITSEIFDTIKWNIETTADGYIIHPDGTTNTWLYSTNTNNGTRVGTNDNKTFVIDSESGYLKHVGTGRYLGVYNKSDWRCYTNTTGNIANQTLGFYVASTTTGTQDYYSSTLPGAKLDSASVTIGDDLSINYYVSILKSGMTIDGCFVKFTFNDVETVVDSCALVDGKYMFTFSGITPEQMGDAIRAELIDSNGETIDIYSGYSVKQNLEDVKALYPTDTALVNLIDATLVYGAAAQQYRDYNTDNLVAEIPGDLTGPDAANVRAKTESTVEGLNFTAAGVNFDYCNRVYARFENTQDEQNVSLKVTIDGVECAFETFVNNGITTVYSDALKATQLDSKVVFQIYQGESLVQQLTYSVNDYVFTMKDTEDTALKNLIFALYQYGVAAKAYNN